MKTPKTIAIIGATGNMGSAIAKSLSTGNYRLLLMADDQDKLDVLKVELVNGGSTAELEINTCAKEASWEADIIVVATPYGTEKEVASRIKEVAVGKIVISVSSPMDIRGRVVPSPNSSAADELQKMLPYSKVIKTFSTKFAKGFISPVIAGKKVDTFIAGNNGDAIDTISDVIRTAGFNPVVAGDLTVSRALENIELRIVELGIKYDYDWLNRKQMFQN
jgi:8-hydroxy-5-deazaflavin:NADPH oxidoreductase